MGKVKVGVGTAYRRIIVSFTPHTLGFTSFARLFFKTLMHTFILRANQKTHILYIGGRSSVLYNLIKNLNICLKSFCIYLQQNNQSNTNKELESHVAPIIMYFLWKNFCKSHHSTTNILFKFFSTFVE